MTNQESMRPAESDIKMQLYFAEGYIGMALVDVKDVATELRKNKRLCTDDKLSKKAVRLIRELNILKRKIDKFRDKVKQLEENNEKNNS